MRLAVVSDLHANYQAWNAVLVDIRSIGVDRIVCLGDIVGYGPHPAEVLQSAYENIDYFVLGNHDAVIGGRMNPNRFNPAAREAIRWTQRQLAPDAMTFLRSIPLVLDGGRFRCAHGDFSQPAAFHYVIEPTDAWPSWTCVDHDLLLVGHTHWPRIFLLGPSGTPHVVDPQDFEMEPGKRYLVNVGSVGQPRDGDIRSSYVVLDTEAASVCWRRIPFDVDAYRADFERTGLPHEVAGFLRHDPRRGLTLLRDQLCFSPARTPAEAVQGAVELSSIAELHQDVRRWRRWAITLVLSIMVLLGLLAGRWWRHATRGLNLDATGSLVTLATGNTTSSLIPPLPSPGPPNMRIAGWVLCLGDRRRQSATVVEHDGERCLLLTSRSRKEPVHFAALPVAVSSGQRLCMQAEFLKSEGFTGSLALVASVARAAGTDDIERYRVKEPTTRRKGGWWRAQETFDVPAQAKTVTLQIHGQFTGTVRIRRIELTKGE